MKNASFAVHITGKNHLYVRGGRAKKGVVVPALLVAAFALTGPTQAEKLDCSGNKRSKQEISSQSIKPGDQPDRELVQFVRVDVIASANPELDKTEMTVYSHMDNVAGAGIHRGYGEYTLTSGEKLWVKFQPAIRSNYSSISIF